MKLGKGINAECVAGRIQTRVIFPEMRANERARTEAYLRGTKKVPTLTVAQRISNATPDRTERSTLHLIKRHVWSVGTETRVTLGAVLNISYGKHARIPGIRQWYYDTILQNTVCRSHRFSEIFRICRA